MADKSYMGTTAIMGATTGFCKIKTPDTGNPNAKNKNFRNTPPKWTAEIIIDRERDAQFLANLKAHAEANEYDGDKGEEPWIKTRDAKGEYPGYEYISVFTKNNPHEWEKTPGTRIVDDRKMPFTDEVFNGSEVNVVFNPQYTEVHDYRMTFYLDALQVLKNGNGGGGNPMDLLAAPSFGATDEADVMGDLDGGTTAPNFN